MGWMVSTPHGNSRGRQHHLAIDGDLIRGLSGIYDGAARTIEVAGAACFGTGAYFAPH